MAPLSPRPVASLLPPIAAAQEVPARWVGSLEKALEAARLPSVELYLRDAGVLRVGREGGEVMFDWLPGAEEPEGGDEDEVCALRWADEELGRLSWHAVNGHRAAAGETFRELAADLSLAVQRRRLAERTRRALGRDLHLHGFSRPIRELERLAAKAAQVDLPVLVEGEFGSEKVPTACVVHFSSARREGPFRELCCATLTADDADDVEATVAGAAGGTLLLNGVDELDEPGQTLLLRLLGSQVGQWLHDVADRAASDVRLVSTTTQNLRRLTTEGGFSRALFAELAFLPLYVPPVRQRREDVPYLVDFVLRKAGRDGLDAIDDEALELCAAYDWPGNVFEMERLLGRLLALVPRRPIAARDLARYAPELVSGAGIAADGTPPPVAEPDLGALTVEEMAVAVADGELDDFTACHPAVQRALRYISDHYRDEIMLGDLASAAHVSPSHLCHLLKTTLGITFKPLLSAVRIERAKELLVEKSQQRITDISLDVGFGDLSHFEKTFKRHVRLNPREFRRRMLRQARCRG